MLPTQHTTVVAPARVCRGQRPSVILTSLLAQSENTIDLIIVLLRATKSPPPPPSFVLNRNIVRLQKGGQELDWTNFLEFFY